MHQERTINKHSCQNSLRNFISIITTLSRKETTVAFPLTITVLNVMGPKEAKFPLESYVRERGNPKPWYQPEEDFPGGDTTQLR